MNNILFASIAALCAVAGAAGTLAYVRRSELRKSLIASTEQIDGELQMDDIVAFFRCLNLNKDVDTPFLANGDSSEFKKLTKGLLPPRDGYRMLMLGVFNSQKDEITTHKFIYCAKLSQEIMETMGNNPFVVLG